MDLLDLAAGRQTTPTPWFVLWSLEHECPLRELSDVTSVEQTERLLRGVQLSGDAYAAGRVKNAIALHPQAASDEEPLGFLVDQVLAPFGGRERVGACCEHCPANVYQRQQRAFPWAGCFGWLVPQGDAELVIAQASATVATCRAELPASLVSTNPAWFSLWIEETLSEPMIAWHANVMSRLTAENVPLAGLANYSHALQIAAEFSLPLNIRYYSPGACHERRWTTAAHCGRCHAPWPEARRQQCRSCGIVGGRQTERTRKRIGRRPWRALSEFLSSEEIAKLMVKQA